MSVDMIQNQKTIQQMIDESAKRTGTRNTGELGKDDFLNLLITQLRYQDPMEPLDDKEFIAQMAQFSSLEQMQNMNSSLSQVQAFSLIGKRAVGSVIDETSEQVKAIEGEVTSVKMSAGKTYAVINNTDVPIDRITNVSDASEYNGAGIQTLTGLLGNIAEGFVYNPDNGELVPVNGLVKSLKTGSYENYAVIDGARVQVDKVNVAGIDGNVDMMLDYLEEHKDGNGEVELSITDSVTEAKVDVTAKLGSYTYDAETGKIEAVLNNLSIAVDSIYGIQEANSND